MRLFTPNPFENHSDAILPPNPGVKIYFAIRQIYPFGTYTEVVNDQLDDAFDADVSQYGSPGGEGVFGIKSIPIPEIMKQSPGWYLLTIFETGDFPATETAFYLQNQSLNQNEINLEELNEKIQILTDTFDAHRIESSETIQIIIRKLNRILKQIK